MRTYFLYSNNECVLVHDWDNQIQFDTNVASAYQIVEAKTSMLIGVNKYEAKLAIRKALLHANAKGLLNNLNISDTKSISDKLVNYIIDAGIITIKSIQQFLTHLK